jgi:hypothetical protein
VIVRERLVGETQIDRPRTAAAVRERRQAARVLDERRECVRADEPGKLAGPGLAHLCATTLDQRPIEIDDVVHGAIVRGLPIGKPGPVSRLAP